MEQGRKLHKLIFTVLAAVLLFFLIIFAGWFIVPSRTLDIAVLDKTVSTGKIDQNNDISSDYRKHIGLFWLLGHNKYKNPNTGKLYNYKKDYYGPMVSDEKAGKSVDLKRFSKTPDMIYIADTYGDESNKSSVSKGVNYSEMSAISTAHLNGATVIGETDIVTATKDSVAKELEGLFGIQYSDWTGRYIYDMEDLTDIPEWALTLHEQEYGRKWDYKGSGILLVSRTGEIIVLQQGKDFNGQMMSIEISDGFQKQFGKRKINYYNWFEIVNEDYGTETVAEFKLDLNESGKKKFSKISNKASFPAITKKTGGKAPAYYFAGDFNDYVAKRRYSKALFADQFYRFFSYDRPGDITNFYWNFYYPFMQDILKEVKSNRSAISEPVKNTQSNFRINGGNVEQLSGGEWKTFDMKGFNINGVMPGDQPYEYTRDSSVYRQFISEVSAMNGNCVRVYDLMPPEFYRAIYEHNLQNPKKKVYFMQSIVPPDNIAAGQYFSSAAMDEIKKNIEYVVDAVHGNATVPKVGSRAGGEYINDVSAYLIGFITEFDSDAKTVKTMIDQNPEYQYAGEYVSSVTNAAEGLSAFLCDYSFTYQNSTYGYISPVGARGNQQLIPSIKWTDNTNGAEFDVSRMDTTEKAANNFFVAYSLKPYDSMLLGNTAEFSAYKDEKGSFAYGGYIAGVKKLQTRYPILIDRFGLSTSANSFEKEESVNGLSETEQGNEVVRMMKAIKREGFLGGMISDLNDSWSLCSKEYEEYVVSMKNNPLWQNVLDPAQNSGILAIEPEKSSKIEMSLKDTGRVNEIILAKDEAFLYATILLEKEVNYDKEQLIIGLDTYQRNNGEYLYDPKYYATSLSGMEYIVKFESKSSASLFVTPSYNRSKGHYSSKESYDGKFDYIAPLEYGTFDNSNHNFYQTGGTLHIRIPWSALNFTDPSQKMVMNDTRSAEQIQKDGFGVQITSTNGVILSLLIADKHTKDSLYIFPESKQSSGYKTFGWSNWEKPDYQIREKDSYKILSRYFTS